jgi:hypothetical protein
MSHGMTLERLLARNAFARDHIDRFPECACWSGDFSCVRSDAEYYVDRWGPDLVSPGLRASARALLRMLDRTGV